MSDELQVTVVNDPTVVTVPQTQVETLVEQVVLPVAVESPEVQVVTIDNDVHVVNQSNELQVVTVGEVGPPGPVGPSGAATTETYTAGENLGGDRIVVTDAAGQAIYVDYTNPAHANQAVRITTQAASVGDSISAQLSGRITEPSWNWTPGATLYVGANALPTETVPTAPAAFSKPFAVAETATRILMIHEPPVMLA